VSVVDMAQPSASAAPFVLVTAVGQAEGARGAAAALACAGADVDRAALLIDVGGRPPRPTLLASAAARELEERLTAHLPAQRPAARGQVCHLAVGEEEALAVVSAAAAVARGGLVAIHLPPPSLQPFLAASAPEASGVLLRADVSSDRPLLALLAADLRGRGLALAVLKRRLGWAAERRALFGLPAPGNAAGAASKPFRNLLSHKCYAAQDDSKADPTRAAQSEWRDHAGTRSR
jgi:hypothetical protein